MSPKLCFQTSFLVCFLAYCSASLLDPTPAVFLAPFRVCFLAPFLALFVACVLAPCLVHVFACILALRLACCLTCVLHSLFRCFLVSQICFSIFTHMCLGLGSRPLSQMISSLSSSIILSMFLALASWPCSPTPFMASLLAFPFACMALLPGPVSYHISSFLLGIPGNSF